MRGAGTVGAVHDTSGADPGGTTRGAAVNPISKVTGAITHPVRTATNVAGGAMGVAAAGVRTATRIVGRAAGQGEERSEQSSAPAGSRLEPPSSADHDGADSTTAPTVSPTLAVKDAPARAKKAPGENAAAKKAPAKTAPAKRTAAKKAPAEKAPAEKAAAEKAAAKKASAKKSPARKAPAKRTTAKKAPSARAATAGPALSTDELAAVDPAAGPAPALDADPQTSHVETETEVVYSSETGSGTGGGSDDTLSEPLLDPAVAETLRTEVEQATGAADPDDRG